MARMVVCSGYRMVITYFDNKHIEKVRGHRWALSEDRDGYFFVYTHINSKKIYLHKFLVNAGGDVQVDHIDRDRLNNRDNNLRICTTLENARNKGKSNVVSRSKYKGLVWKPYRQYWEVYVGKDRHQYYGGFSRDEKVAARIYNDLALLLHGEFAVLNQLETDGD